LLGIENYPMKLPELHSLTMASARFNGGRMPPKYIQILTDIQIPLNREFVQRTTIFCIVHFQLRSQTVTSRD